MVFEVQYLWNGWVKKDGATLMHYDWLDFRYPVDFAFRRRLTTDVIDFITPFMILEYSLSVRLKIQS